MLVSSIQLSTVSCTVWWNSFLQPFHVSSKFYKAYFQQLTLVCHSFKCLPFRVPQLCLPRYSCTYILDGLDTSFLVIVYLRLSGTYFNLLFMCFWGPLIPQSQTNMPIPCNEIVLYILNYSNSDFCSLFSPIRSWLIRFDTYTWILRIPIHLFKCHPLFSPY